MRPTDTARRPMSPCAHRLRGVTLIELVVVITITGIIAVVLGTFIVRPIEGFQAQVRRAELVDAAEMALRRTARDIRQALPNSVRVTTVGGRSAIEMLNTIDGARYRDGPGTLGSPTTHNHSAAKYRLRFNGADLDGFNAIGHFRNIENLFGLPFPSTTHRLAIYSQEVTETYTDAASLLGGARVITNPATTTFRIVVDDHAVNDGFDEHNVELVTGSFHFRYTSNNQRVFVVDTPITYVCVPGPAGTITRYWDYTVNATQPDDPAVAPLSDAGTQSALLTRPVTACRFTYTGGTNTRAGLVTLDITVRDAASGEQVRLLHQVHVDNFP
ncbi:MAG: type II secretion system GspH family protein [Sulfuricaulis sp.]|nr:type II secretion system GspH family protein [Sulfuricaulis sp.]